MPTCRVTFSSGPRVFRKPPNNLGLYWEGSGNFLMVFPSRRKDGKPPREDSPTMKKALGFIFAGLLSAGLLAGCNSSSNNGNNGFGTNCGKPPPGFQILYPRNNAPRVPPNNATAVYVAAKPPLVIGNSYN